MEEIIVKDLMVPLSDYAPVGEDATMGDAILALEKAEKMLKGGNSSGGHGASPLFARNQGQ